MADPYLDLLDNVATAINAASIDDVPTAVVRFNPRKAMEKLPAAGVLFVTAPADAITEDPEDYDDVKVTYRVYIILVIQGEDEAEADPDTRAGITLLGLIRGALRGRDITGEGGATYQWSGSPSTPVPFDIEKLQDDRIYFGVLQMTYSTSIENEE